MQWMQQAAVFLVITNRQAGWLNDWLNRNNAPSPKTIVAATLEDK